MTWMYQTYDRPKLSRGSRWEVITFRTWLRADVLASLIFGQTQTKCVRVELLQNGVDRWGIWRPRCDDWTGQVPVIHLSHVLYSAVVQRRMTFDDVTPSLCWRRSVAKTVLLRFLTARRELETDVFSRRLLFGALSLGSGLPLFSASFLTTGLTRNQKGPYF